jgi:hypothetical protein
MTDCLHTRFRVHAEVQRYAAGADAPAVGFTLQAQVVCEDCRAQFTFDPEATIPGHDEPGAYVNPEGWAMEVPLSPPAVPVKPSGD